MTDEHNVPGQFAPALARLDGDKVLLREMAAITTEDFPEVQADLESAIEEQDCQRMAGALHRIKGMLSTFETDGVTLEIQEMLDVVRKQEFEQGRQLYSRHKPAIAALVKQVEQLTESS